MPTHRLVILGLFAAFLLVVAIDSWRKQWKARQGLRPPEPLAAPDSEPRPDA